MKVVFIGVDPRISEMALMSVRLRWPDTMPLVSSTASEGLELVERVAPDVVILHPDFTDMSLAQSIHELRRFSNVPLMVLGRQGDEMEVVTSLESGADDYIRLPCDLTEMTTRMWALIRRVGVAVSHERESPLMSGRLLVNPATYEVFLDGQRIALTSTEFRLLYLLVRNRGTVVSHQAVERALWGDQSDSSGLVKKYVQRLRKKLEDDSREPRWIASVHGVGYRFIGPTPAAQEELQPVLAGR
ncbi:MAG: response regulator transcription factor [SAR202 cluster bacterium]|nr:response regulator transcription factor [SAR202 cluster bacterium]